MEYIDLELPKAGDTVIVGLSGGVDSTTTALLLKEKGCNVIGVTMSVWDGHLPDVPEGTELKASCYGPSVIKNVEECKTFCQQYNIPYHVIDVSKPYRELVLEYFKHEYRSGRTPNPCVQCNSTVKFGALLEGIKELGIEYDYFCTGHYARMVRGTEPIKNLYGNQEAGSDNGNKRPAQIAVALDTTKDQAYFLNRISSDVLEKVRFPLATYTKKQVFEIAREKGLFAAQRAESQDFLSDEYLADIFSDKPSVPGNFIDVDGKVLGRHKGIEHYTIGQRRGLGVSYKEPLYVAEIDKDKNIIVLGVDSDLFCSALIADDFVWPGDYEPEGSFDAMVKIRFASRPVLAHVEPYVPEDGERFNGKAYKFTFDKPQRAVAPGQACVMYIDGVSAGGGIIARAVK